MRLDRILRLAAPALAAAFLSSCESLQISGGGRTYDLGKVVSAAQRVKEALVISPETERRIGREAAANLAAKHGIFDDPGATRYVNLVGLALVRKARRKDVSWRFAVLNTLDVNAYASPGGFIFVTKGLVKMCEDESELAAVLAHEIQHVDRKHALTALRRNNLIEAGSEWLKKDLDIASRFIIGQMERGFDKGDELEADRHGILLLAKAGYDPTGLPRALEAQHNNLGDPHSAPFTARHPSFEERMRALSKLKADLPETGAVLKKRFLDHTAI